MYKWRRWGKDVKINETKKASLEQGKSRSLIPRHLEDKYSFPDFAELNNRLKNIVAQSFVANIMLAMVHVQNGSVKDGLQLPQ